MKEGSRTNCKPSEIEERNQFLRQNQPIIQDLEGFNSRREVHYKNSLDSLELETKRKEVLEVFQIQMLLAKRLEKRFKFDLK